MDATQYTKILESSTSLSIGDDHDWVEIDEFEANVNTITIKFFDRRTDRYVSSVYSGIYGLGFQGRGSLFQPGVPKTSWAWDQLNEIRFEQWPGNIATLIETNLFKYHIEGSENVSLFESLYTMFAWHSSLARFLIGEPMPRLNRPIDANLIAALELPNSCFVEGYPDFSGCDLDIIKEVLVSNANSKKSHKSSDSDLEWTSDWSGLSSLGSSDEKSLPSSHDDEVNGDTSPGGFDLESFIETLKSSEFPAASISESYVKGNYVIVKDIDGKIISEIKINN